MTDFLQQTFALVCGQNPAHTWAPGGALLPFCQRCTGLYAGAAFGFLLLALCRPRLDARYRWLHAGLLLAMAPFGFHLLPQDGILRTLSGQWFGFGVVGLLWLLPHAGSFKAAGQVVIRGRIHLLLGAASLVCLQVFIRWGGSCAAAVLPWLAFGGFLILAGLVALNLGILLSSMVVEMGRHSGRAAS